MARILRDAGLSDLVEPGEVECLARGFVFTEGPLWCPDGSLLFQDNKAEKTYRLAPDRSVHPLRERTGAANGQTFGPDGRIVFCEQNGRRVSRMGRDGSGVETLAENWSGRRLNSPNDIVCRSDGIAYFTDPPYGVRPADRELHFQGVYSLDLRPGATGRGGLEPQLLLDDLEKPNGLAFSPDETILYICDTARYHIRAFDVEPSGSLRVGSGRLFARMDPETPGGPDGVKVDGDGRVYAAVAQGVWVYEPDGRLLGIIAMPDRPANLAWCDPDARGLAMTAVDAVYSVRMRVEGQMPPFLG
jgi:gluconolactonase